MKIVVLLKEVPDTFGVRRLNLETGLIDRGSSEPVLDEICERALEVALAHADSSEGVEVDVVTVGPESAENNVRKALAMGADSAILVADEGLIGADIGLTAETLAKVLQETDYDLIIAGNQSTDGSSGMLAPWLAELLGVPVATNLKSVTIGDGRVSGEQAGDGVTQEVMVPLPAVISVTEQLPEGRFPNFKGIRAAKKKPLRVKSLADLGIDPLDMSMPRVVMTSVVEPPPREVGFKLVDDGTAAQQLVASLADKRLI